MQIKVQYLGPVQVLVNKREEEVEVAFTSTISELLTRLVDMYGKGFEKEIFEDNGKNIRDDLIIAVNGTAIKQLNGMQTALNRGDIVSLLPIFAGGG